MKSVGFVLALLAASVAAAVAQDAIPNLRGTWSGKGKSIVFGTNPHARDRRHLLQHGPRQAMTRHRPMHRD